MLSADKRTLAYYLHSPGSSHYHYKPVGQITLERDPQAFLGPTFDQLNTLARLAPAGRSAAETEDAVEEQKRIGINLYDQLFPAAFKQEYLTLREWMAGDGRTTKSLLITSDEPWIPWELVRPFLADEEGRIVYDDPPLCEMFQVSRWLAGRGAPERLAMQRGAWVASADNLQAVEVEAKYFAELHRLEWDVALSGPLTTVAKVRQRFEAGDTQLFHFACHGNFASDDPNESALKLQGDFLRPSQIIGAQVAGLRRAKPLVFLNACQSGETGFALTQLGGWAQRFLDAGASAFIGSLWEINDQLAAQFAREFYNRLWGINEQRGKPQPLGQAFHEARLVIKACDPANPTWLAYVLYGDPLGRVVLGEPGAG